MGPAPFPSVTGVDSHAHVFQPGLSLAADRRYNPDYSASVDSYLAHLDHAGLSHGVLIQPSFLGTDNSFMVESLRAHPRRLRGVAVVAPNVTDSVLDELDTAGVVGIRLNLVGKSLSDYTGVEWRRLFERVAARHWQIEIQRQIDDLSEVMEMVLPSGAVVVVDHFGLPADMRKGTTNGHRAFLERLADDRVWVKLSAMYRSDLTLERAGEWLEEMLRAGLAEERLLWGSDWPHTRHEVQQNYRGQWQLLERLVMDPSLRRKILVDNPREIFGL
ncbi:amidohydrolase family protein [Halomonas elongata]|uniref:amidohydrolase family protein n=1 Tax=Halomonas elongata TaxID=2746 RepID=UPI00255B0D77|nr:amidohydrolase family protein [Halomonas elongata]MDL4861552.1 amidohydrolase family protein [Halomonas elongata]